MPDLTLQLEELRREIRALRDRQDILDCINAYGRGLDRLDAQLIHAESYVLFYCRTADGKTVGAAGGRYID